MDIQLDNLRPHATLSVFRSGDAPSLITEVFSCLEALAKTLPRMPESDANGNHFHEIAGRRPPGLSVRAAWYKIEQSPPWIGAESPTQADGGTGGADKEPLLIDVQHHLVVLMAHEGFVVVFASQETMRARINALIENGGVEDKGKAVRSTRTAARLERSELEQVFVRGRTRNAWLEGLHAPTKMKPSRKIMSGPDLRYAFDAYGDQTFLPSAVVSEHRDTATTGKSAAFRVGVSHHKYTLWTAATKTFDGFVEEMNRLVRLLKAGPADDGLLPERERAGLPMLARAMEGATLSMLADGFDVSYEVPTTSEKELILGGGSDEREAEDEDPWQRDGQFVVVMNAGSSPAEIVADALYQETPIARITLRPQWLGNQHIDLLHQVVQYRVAKDHPFLVHLDRSLARRNKRFTLRYGSGHIVQSGTAYELKFSDVIFKQWRWLDFEKDGEWYKLNQEKPEKNDGSHTYDPSRIGQDHSLFCYLKNFAEDLVVPDVGVKPSADWMLLCDDGAGEIADFVALDPGHASPFVTFVHVKAAKGNAADIAWDPFSLVVGQTQKNLRDYDVHHLAEDLARRTNANNRRLVWRRGTQPMDRNDFVAALRRLAPHAQRHVIVFQPRILHATWDAAVTGHRNSQYNANVGRMRHVSTSLSLTEEELRRLGATFTVFGMEKAPPSMVSAAKSVVTRSRKPSPSKKRRAKASR